MLVTFSQASEKDNVQKSIERCLFLRVAVLILIPEQRRVLPADPPAAGEHNSHNHKDDCHGTDDNRTHREPQEPAGAGADAGTAVVSVVREPWSGQLSGSAGAGFRPGLLNPRHRCRHPLKNSRYEHDDADQDYQTYSGDFHSILCKWIS